MECEQYYVAGNNGKTSQFQREAVRQIDARAILSFMTFCPSEAYSANASVHKSRSCKHLIPLSFEPDGQRVLFPV
jgi:hypothetical protein